MEGSVELRVEGVSVAVQGRVVVEEATLAIRGGELHLLLGPNASGKTSLLSAIAGLPGFEVVEGRILLDGVDITGEPAWRRARLGVALAHQNPPAVRHVRASSLIGVLRRIYRVPDSEVSGVARLLEVEELLERPLFKGFSGGERKRLELLLVLLQKPRIALLDEPDSGVDVDSIDLIARAVEYLVKRGTGVLLVTHTSLLLDRLKALGLKARAHVLLNGRLRLSGDADDVIPLIIKHGYRGVLEALGGGVEAPG